MIRKTAVLTRVGLLPAIAALCVTSSLAVRAENPAATQAGTPTGAQTNGAPAATPAPTTAAAPIKVEDPSTKSATAAAPQPPASPVATTTTAATENSPKADDPSKTTSPTVSTPAAGATAAASPAASTTEPAKPGEPPKATAALPDASGTTPDSAPAQVLPPADPIVAGIRQRLSELGKKASEDDAAALAAYYGELTGTAIWASTSGLTEKGKAVVAEIGRADNWGLPASAFDVPSAGASNLTPEAAADAELQVALAVLKYARYARGGRVNPGSISQLMDQRPTLVPPRTVLSDIATAEKPDAYLVSLHPKHPQFEALRQVLLKLRGGEVKEEVPVVDPALAVKLPMGRIIRPGSSDEQVALLRQRLKVTADDPANENVYDEKLQEAVREFQRGNGLRPDGVVGNGTRQVLNGGPAPPPPATNDSKIERILINMERWRWVPADMGEFYVWDNVPEFLTRIVKGGNVVHTDEIIVGQPSWPTPIFSADMKTVVFRPSWGVPAGIKAKELAPLLRKSSGAGFFGIFGGGYSAQAVLDAYDLKAYAGGRQIDPNSVDWASVNIHNYSFQQPPGPKNVLGDVKFMFPNSHDVYMHDTPERNLFGKAYRALSHGCMRVHEPRRFAEVLLAEDKGWSAAKVQSMFSSGGEVGLDKHIPVHITYFTARVDDDGKLHTYGDFYGLDGRTAAALTGKSIRFEQPSYPGDDVVATSDDGPIGQQQYTRRKKKQSQYGGPTSLSDAISGLFSP
ncbi:MAG: L,D-transpeptidase family protein [Hyphomicrobium sp.]|uniref:L,D-transpeptidase family protein n=1 Tax=Hyphomicrobium sp. TaxID=82 RepID=UPI001324460D|nr:L,D-transpeptidase family protein [Hyphomicrobium sp.]KAB2941390.1 MAG: L,D-transpeptidase family protein [Hyphomicrobium sp.]MBZ0212041.1 L,D-transpeptidase family protein [Hyphomicrobium sp.]MCZ7595892.1 L,D-transpeptidase family protein [Hyphomicrobium sp.]